MEIRDLIIETRFTYCFFARIWMLFMAISKLVENNRTGNYLIWERKIINNNKMKIRCKEEEKRTKKKK